MIMFTICLRIFWTFYLIRLHMHILALVMSTSHNSKALVQFMATVCCVARQYSSDTMHIANNYYT